MKKFWIMLNVFLFWACVGETDKAPTKPQEPEPLANFAAIPTTVNVGEKVSFTSFSFGSITSLAWNVDDDSSIEANTSTFLHSYEDIGTYDVTLTVTGPGGNNSKTVEDMITVMSANYFELIYGGEQGELFEAYENIVDGPDKNGFLVQSFSEGATSSAVDCSLCIENELHNIVAYTTQELRNQFPEIDWKDISVIDGDHLISFYADGRNNDHPHYPGVGGGPADGSFSTRAELSDNRTKGRYTNGDERFYSLSFWAPSDIWDVPTNFSVIISQWKQFSGGHPDLIVTLSQEGDYGLFVSGKNNIPFQKIATAVPDQWNHLKYYVKHSTDSDGEIIIWLNGIKVFSHEGITLYYSGKDGYLKFGMYTGMRDERMLLFDRVKISNELNGQTLDEWSQDQY